MSTLSGLASKGEKGKLKYRSLDINNLYRASRGESSEKQQQKSTPPFKHGMQSLGRVPSARRPPANLPSIKSEHSGTDAAVSLVPSGGPGWGKQDSATPSTTTTPSTTSTTTNCNSSSPSPANIPLTPHQAAIALPVTTTIPPAPKHSTLSVTSAATDKSWSSVMSGNDMIHPPPYQSPQFQHEFPSLSAGDGNQARSGTDTQYGPGPSLRPQTEGSWMQGGSRANSEQIPRSNSAPLGAPPQLSAQVGLAHQQLPSQYHGILPTFMFRGNATANGHGTNTVANAPPVVVNNNRTRVENRPPSIQRTNDSEELARRPIIKEEDLNRMDDMTKDMGWAAQDEIDYNQKLEFSDDEAIPDKNLLKNIGKSVLKEHENKDRQEKTEAYQDESKNWNRNANSGSIPYNRGRNTDEDEILALKRRQQHQVVTTAAERAKQRKEEEEKKYLETKLKNKRDKDQEESQGTISPSVVPPQPITPAPIPVPEWEKEKDPMAKSDSADDNRNPPTKNMRDGTGSDFRLMAQIEAKNFVRKDNRNTDRTNSGYTRQMQNLPPRLQKKQQLRNNSSPQPPMPYTQYDPRWISGGQNTTKTSPTSSLHKIRNEWEGSDKERDDDRLRYSNEDIRRGGSRPYTELGRKSTDNRHSDDNRDGRNQDYDYKKEKDDTKWEKTPKLCEKEDVYDNHMVNRQCSDEWHSDRHDKYRDEKHQDRYERPQRPDSRDSRTSRDSRHSRDSMRDSEPREHLGSWAESIAYEERKKEMKEDRRTVPGPITKEKIEADEKQNEKRNLTQLKKGAIPPVSERKNENSNERPQDKEVETWGNQNKESTNYDSDISKPWADDVLVCSALQEISKQAEIDNSKKSANSDVNISETKEDIDLKKPENIDNNKEKDDKRVHSMNRNRQENNRSQGWDRNSSSVYRSWYKKSKTPRSTKTSSKGNDWLCTDSDGSVDDMCSNDNKDDKGLRNSQKSPKPNNSKKIDKEDRNKDVTRSDKNDKNSDRKIDKFSENTKRETYEPRGEPSRLGRGGGNMRGRGGLSKRIDGYGPPSLKSPFSHIDDKEKKQSCDDPQQNSGEIQNSEKTKMNNNAGIIGSARKEMPPNTQIRSDKKHEERFDRSKLRRSSDNRKPKPGKLKDENGDTSEHSDDSVNKHSRKSNKSPLRSRPNVISRRNQPPRLSGEKRSGNFNQSRNDFVSVRQNSSGSLRSGSVSNKKDNLKDEKQSDANSLCNAIADITLKNKEQNEETDTNDVEVDEKNSGHGDSDGFQEVKSKKTVKDRQKVTEEKPVSKQIGSKQECIKPDRKAKSITSQLSQQQIANIPSLMDTPVNPPAVIPQSINKGTYDRSRNAKLPPRLAKQREQGRLQKVQMHQHNMCDVNDMKKVNQNIGLYGLKDTPSSMQITNAWDKPIQLRSNMETDSVLSIGIENCKSMDPPHSPSQNNSSPNTEKVIGKNDRNQMQDKSVLDGTTPPVNTIIFENTNYKSTPGVRNNRNEKTRTSKIEETTSNIENSVMSSFNKPISDLLSKNDKSDIQMQLSFNKEDTADMKLDFFESDISHLTDDKSTKNLSLPKSMHTMTSSNSTISPSAADLNFKIASVKKVWDNTMPPVLEHNIVQEDSNSSFSTSFGPDPNSLDASSAFSKGTDTSDDAHEGYSTSPNQNVPNSTTNVCKVKPTQQVPGTTGQNVGTHQQHSGIISSGLIAPLSSPPIQPVIGPSVGLNQAPQQYTTNQHIGYQAGLGGSNQYGIPAIPSPPVVYNSTQQLQPQAGLYGGFPIDQLGGQRTSQYSQYANPYSLGQTASSPYSAQSLYLPTAQPHAPPAAQAPPDIYQSINNYRIPNTAPYGQNQQLNNPTTVLISSTSNSLMSASVKPSSQPISAIGTKTGTINQTFQQQSQQGQQPLYMAYEPAMQPNYLPNTGVMQRGPPGPVQNNVVPALQASSSFYSGSTGGQTGYFQQPGNSTLQSGPLQQHQASYGLQGNVFGTHNQSHTSAGLQNLNSHFLSQMQFAMNVQQQYRSQNLQNTSYLKSISNQQVGDQTGRSQQLKSPGTQQEVLSSVFNSGPGPQIPSPKSRQNCKQPPPQPSPTTHKYNLYQSVGNQQSSQTQRYPQPIQRPSVNYQHNLNSVQNNGSNNHKHRTNNPNKGPTRQYYSPQGGGLSNQNEKSDDSKLVDNGTPNSSNSTNSNSTSIVNKTAAIGSVTNSTINKTEITKDKDESSVIKD